MTTWLSLACFMLYIKYLKLSCVSCSSAGMQYHKRSDHFDEKPFSCNDCGAKFAANSTLKNHMRLHTGEKPFFCKLCDMTFVQAAALAYHMKKKHSEGMSAKALKSNDVVIFFHWYSNSFEVVSLTLYWGIRATVCDIELFNVKTGHVVITVYAD